MSKIEDLQRKVKRFEKELDNAKQKYIQQKQIIEKKENELKQAEADLVSALLVNKGLSMDDLANLLNANETYPTGSEVE